MSTPQTARLGVLAADGIHIEGMPHPLTSRGGICRAHDLARCARTLGLTDLWLHPSLLPPHIRLCADWATPPADSPWTIRANKGTPDGALSHWYTAIQSGSYGVVNLCLMPQLPKGTPWLHAESGAALLSSLVAFRDALGGVPWRRSAGATGTRLIREVHAGPHALTLDLPGDPPPPALHGGTESPLLWIRDLTPEEQQRKYLHSYDRNGMYLGACSSLALGFGQPEHITEDAAALWRAFEAKRPGYWLMRVDVQTAAHPLAPPAYREPRRAGDPVWMTFPTLALLVQLGYDLTPLEGWIYPDSHRALEPWYKRVRDARASVRDPLALDAVKDLYRMSLGWLGSRLWDRTGDVLYRPDWRHANVATARANMYRSWLKLHAAGVHPFACGTDAWLLASDEPDPVKACPSALVLGDGLAHWKVAHGGVPMADVLDVLDARASGRLGRLQRWLNARDGRDEAAEAEAEAEAEAAEAEELVTA